MAVSIWIQREQPRCQTADRESRLLHICRARIPLYCFFFLHVLVVALIRRRRQSDHVSRARAHLVSWSPRRAAPRSACARRACQDLGVAYKLWREVSVPLPALFLMRRWVEGRRDVVTRYHGGISINILTCKLNTGWDDAPLPLRQMSGIAKCFLWHSQSVTFSQLWFFFGKRCDVTKGISHCDPVVRCSRKERKLFRIITAGCKHWVNCTTVFSSTLQSFSIVLKSIVSATCHPCITDNHLM